MRTFVHHPRSASSAQVVGTVDDPGLSPSGRTPQIADADRAKLSAGAGTTPTWTGCSCPMVDGWTCLSAVPRRVRFWCSTTAPPARPHHFVRSNVLPTIATSDLCRFREPGREAPTGAPAAEWSTSSMTRRRSFAASVLIVAWSLAGPAEVHTPLPVAPASRQPGPSL